MNIKGPAFVRHWPTDPYAVQRELALRWLGDRYLLAQPQRSPGEMAARWANRPGAIYANLDEGELR